MSRLGPWGYLLFTLWALLASLFVEGWRLVGLTLSELAFGLIYNREGLRPLRRARFWVFVLTAVALGLFVGFSGERTLALGAVTLPREGLAMGLGMAGQAFAITLAFSLGAASLSLSDAVAIFDRLHLRGLGLALGLAMNLLETLREMATVTLQTIRLRGGWRRPFVGLRLFLITVVSNTLRYGDQVVNAAVVRAFDPSAGRIAPLPLRRADLKLLITLLGCSVALWALGGALP